MKGVFQRGNGVDLDPGFLELEPALLVGNRLRFVGLITPDIPVTGFILV